MLEWLSQQSAGQMIGLIAVIGGPLIAITAIVAAAWARVRRAEFLAHQAETEAALKQQMIERGMSADEIVRVLAAGQSNLGKPKPVAEEEVA
jgi:hypothetical protein